MNWTKIGLIVLISILLTLLILMVFRSKIVVASGTVSFSNIGYIPNSPSETPNCDCTPYSTDGTPGTLPCTSNWQNSTTSVKIPSVDPKDVTIILSVTNFDFAPTGNNSMSNPGDIVPQFLNSTRYSTTGKIVDGMLEITLSTWCSGVIYGADVDYTIIQNSI
jgi:hypothetical protein